TPAESGSTLGKEGSGMGYAPDKNTGLGLRGTVLLGTHLKPETFNGEATLEMVFHDGGGIKYISLAGNGYFATNMGGDLADKLKKGTEKLSGALSSLDQKVFQATHGLLATDDASGNLPENLYGSVGSSSGEKGQISAHVKLSYDFENKVLHGNMEVYVNLVNGVMKGTGPSGKAGWAVVHFAPEEWYIHIGSPENRLGLTASVGPLNAGLTAYLMAGTEIPGSPPPPDEVGRILGGVDLDYMRDENALASGGGFAFGAAFSVDTGDMSFMMFYARLAAGVGFDVMMKNYGQSMQCAGESSPAGVNGWYANGQAYAYFEGMIGINIKLLGQAQKIDIINLSAATVLQAKMPNPFWMRGIVGGRYSILNGLVKGNCRFEVVLGKKCELNANSVLDGVEIIADLSPRPGDQEIDVFTAPQVVFNIAPEKTFEMISEEGVRKSFRLKIETINLKDNGNQSIPGEMLWNDEGDVLTFNPQDILPPRTKIAFEVKVTAEENQNGLWKPVIQAGKEFFESKSTSFTTGDAPDYIPEENIAFSYPAPHQINFHKKEVPTGYIQLKQGQPYLFEQEDWQVKGLFTDESGTSYDAPLNYLNQQISFSIPSGLENGRNYNLQIVSIPKKQTEPLSANIQREVNALASNGDESAVEIQSGKITKTLSLHQEKQLYSYPFRTSQYSTFGERIDHLTLEAVYPWALYTGIHEIAVEYQSDEPFHPSETTGEPQPMIQLMGDRENRWFVEKIEPLVYPSHANPGFQLSWRSENELGIPPFKAVQSESTLGKGKINYRLPLIMYYDYADLKQQIANAYLSQPDNSWYQKMLTSPYPGLILEIPYTIHIRY
ncbi:MAG: DUF1410 domain-containing protein, partial [Cyclobacteriaceae bacterium]|nr:DUF1410 domain-containing protein [Cyclobacteriaceae bacterium]